jgi:hypothetical protein
VGVSERLTISFADAERRVQGVAIAGVGALLTLDGKVSVAAAPVFTEHGERRQVSSPGSFELTLDSWGRFATLWDDGTTVVPCSATGTVGSAPFDGLATLTRANADSGSDVALERSLAIHLDRELVFALAARRPRSARGHGEEQREAVVFRGDPLEPARIERPRLSSTYDETGRLAHAGLELLETEDSEFAMRIGGEALGEGELAHPGGAHTRVTFVAWHHDGRHGLGSYSITSSP